MIDDCDDDDDDDVVDDDDADDDDDHQSHHHCRSITHPNRWETLIFGGILVYPCLRNIRQMLGGGSRILFLFFFISKSVLPV